MDFLTENKTEYNLVLMRLQNYMFNEDNIQKYLAVKVHNDNDNVSKKIITSKNVNVVKNHVNNKIFVPLEKDSLFWCFYIMKYNYENYEMHNYKNIILEKKIKIEYIERIRKEKQLIKTYKFATLLNLEDNLLNSHKTSISTFLTLCVIENLNVLVISKKTYYELLMNDTSEIHVIYLFENGKCGYENVTKDNAAHKTKDFYKLENIVKPIKSIASYNVSELIDICKKLAIEFIVKETGKHKPKKDLYEAIIQYF